MPFRQLLYTGMNTPIAQIDALSFSYPDFPVLHQLSAHIPTGLTLVTGGEGRGKSSLAGLLHGSLAPAAGTIRINGTDCTTDAAMRRTHVFFVPPATTDFDQVTVTEYLRTTCPSAYQGEQAAMLAEGLSLVPHLDKQLFMLSTGSRRKVWLLAAMLSDKPLTVLDDPFSSLDMASVNFAIAALNRTFAGHEQRACVITAYEPVARLEVVHHIDLGD